MAILFISLFSRRFRFMRFICYVTKKTVFTEIDRKFLNFWKVPNNRAKRATFCPGVETPRVPFLVPVVMFRGWKSSVCVWPPA